MTPAGAASRASRRIAAVLLLVPLAGCLNVLDPSDSYNRYGAIVVRGFGGGAARTSATASGVFFSGLTASIPDSRNVQNGCTTSAVDTSTTPASGDLRAGTAITLLTGAGSNKTTTALPFNSAGRNYLGASPFTYAVGDSATLNVPGETGGFAASTVTVRLAEPIIPQDITVPTDGTNMVLRWNPGDSTSAVILSIKYSFPATVTYPNEQLICALRDDGVEELTQSALNAFLQSPVASRSAKFTRWRTQVVEPDSRSILHIVSTVDSTAKLK